MIHKYLNLKKYLSFIMRQFVNFLSPFIKKWEDRFIKKYLLKPLKYQPVFIIGAPRTGSTILYQVITNQLDILYVNNLVCKFYKNLFFGFWLSDKLFKQKAHDCFKSDHGDTSTCGLNSPSECGGFWYKWLRDDKHFIDYDEITDEIVHQIRDELTAVINYFDKPLIFKNLNAGQRMRLLHKCFPEAKFIFIKREPLFTAQSILKAKRKEGLNDNDFWSIMPYNVEELKKLSTYEQIVKQIYFLEKQILEDSKLFDKKSLLSIDYKELGDDFENTVKKCQKFISTDEKTEFKKAEIKLREKVSLKEDEIKSFSQEIEKLDWENYSDK
ncbi:hypothetical protein CP960_01745 [Malaciobacter halophilus]|uniref:Sulfotransferase family protein n=1 Tax=Malaciobacter halophilus TaxID=197482 RepID=A0A2N1J5J9_9BACT|nr:sulfotransferase [Malaciobacter halophilus]AXH09209.1 sulfotransferase [Malaciobacter halophilus]PKI81845.1 hypothetical protein CP960_01745 [Malaciobacter halophilus]